MKNDLLPQMEKPRQHAYATNYACRFFHIDDRRRSHKIEITTLKVSRCGLEECLVPMLVSFASLMAHGVAAAERLLHI